MFTVLPKLKGVDRQVVLNDVYQTYFGLFNTALDSGKQPLSSVAYFKQEDPVFTYSIKNSAVNYSEKNIKEFFDISFLEFINLPISIVNELIEAADIIASKKGAAMNGVLNDFNGVGKK